MIERLYLRDFKSFRQAEFNLCPFTLLIGKNGSGKSNLRDAFIFLEGVGYGYSLMEALGSGWSQKGEQNWSGIRGGYKEVVNKQSLGDSFGLTVEINDDQGEPDYLINILADLRSGEMDIEKKILKEDPFQKGNLSIIKSIKDIVCNERGVVKPLYHALDIYPYQATFRNIGFLNPLPHLMRRPAPFGETYLGEQGENLSAVLYSICQDPKEKRIIIDWIEEIHGQQIKDIEFVEDKPGYIHFNLIESDSQRISVYNLSDGTLRFLGYLAALSLPKSSQIYFFEEIERSIHPTRLHLLTQLFENRAKHRGFQIIATTQSPLILEFLRGDSLDYASLVYKHSLQSGSKIIPLKEIDNFQNAINIRPISGLHAQGWFENIMSFVEGGE